MSRQMVMAAVVTVILMTAYSPLVEAQGGFEITPFIGFTWSEGSEFNTRFVNGIPINTLTPTSGLSWGIQGDFRDENWGLGFQFSRQSSALEVGSPGLGVENQVVTDMRVRNYHAMFTHIAGREADQLRPYFFGGLGATSYSFDPIMGNAVDGESRFSSTFGGGVRFYPSDEFGVRVSGRWTPTYINSTQEGIWCSPYWGGGCWVVQNANFSHQFEMGVGVIFRF